jgi:hypothetical protein
VNSASWILSNVVLFFVVGALMACFAVYYKAFEARMRALPRASLWGSAMSFLALGTAGAFQLYGCGVPETVFRIVAAVLFVISLLLMFFGRDRIPYFRRQLNKENGSGGAEHN